MDPLSSSTQSPQITLVEEGRIENLEEGPFAHTPIDLQVMLCWELFITDMKSLPSLFCICQAMNNICRRKFLTKCEIRIAEYVQSRISQEEKHEAICRAYGASTPPPAIMKLVEELEFSDALSHFPTDLPPRLFCTKLSISLKDNETLLSQINSRRLPYLKDLRITSPHMTAVKTSSAPSKPRITREGLTSLADGCPDMARLELSGCYGITHADLETFAKKCPSISNIFLTGSKLPSVHDSVQLLLIVPTLSFIEIVRKQPKVGFFSIMNGISVRLKQETIQQITERLLAFATLGLFDLAIFTALIFRLSSGGTPPGLVEQAKLHWACKKLKTNPEYAFPQGVNEQERKVVNEVEKELNEQDRLENRPANRKKAAALIMDLLELFPKD